MSTSRRFILETLREASVIDLNGDKGDSCLMHPEASHDVETVGLSDLRMIKKGGLN